LNLLWRRLCGTSQVTFKSCTTKNRQYLSLLDVMIGFV
jgi:hypothetical protein